MNRNIADPGRRGPGLRGAALPRRSDFTPLARRRAPFPLFLLYLFLGMSGKAGENAKDPLPNAGTASVRLVIEDALGQALPQAALLYDGSSAEWSKPLARSEGAEAAISIAPGRYWLVSAADESHSELVTLAAGEKKDVARKVDRGLWLTVADGASKQQKKVLLVLRPKPEMEQWLTGSRRGPDDSMAARRPDATEKALEDAHAAALAALPTLVKEKDEAPATSSKEERDMWRARRSVELDAARRILAITGKPDDVNTLLGLLTPETPAWWREDLTLVMGLIEARHDVLEQGRLVKMLDQDDQAWHAARALHQLGLPLGKEVLRRWLVPERYTTAYWLVTDTSPATLGAMRAYLRHDAFKTRRPPPEACLYLLTYGGLEDWKLVASLTLDQGLISDLAMSAAQDPRTLIPNGTVAIQPLRDRSPEEFEALRDWMNNALAVVNQKAHPELHPRQAYDAKMNAVVLMESNLFPDARAVRFYRGFSGATPISEHLTSDGYLASYLTWFPYPESVDLFVKEWLAGNIRNFSQLDYIEPAHVEEAVKRIGGGRVPPGYELHRAYHRIAHRQRRVIDPFPNGERRWPYLLAYREKTPQGGEHFGGGISGVASLRAHWRDSTLVLRLRLDQRAHYEQANTIAGIGNRQTATEYPHHPYTLEAGRSLIDSVIVRRGTRPFVASYAKQDEGGWHAFEASMDSASLADLWVDVNLKFFDQTITLTESLSFGVPARLLRQARYEAGHPDENEKSPVTSHVKSE